MTDAGDTPNPLAPGRRSAPDEVWAAVRDDYLAGMSAPEACRRHGVGLTALRLRAAREGWRRADQPWTPPDRLDPWDEGVALDEAVGGDLDQVELPQLSWIAFRRMMRAVLRGDAVDALRWRRVREAMDAEEAEIDCFMAREDEMRARLFGYGADEANDATAVNGVSGGPAG